MIITRTPFRLSFLGGGSDLAGFYSRSEGAVLSTTINRYLYLSAHPYFDARSYHLRYSRRELVQSLEAVEHPIIQCVLRRLRVNPGIEITSTADVPAGTGLGSSSSFTVGLLHLLYAVQGRQVPAEQLAREACEVEIHDLGAPIGKQDQFAAAVGGFNFIRFAADETVDVRPLVISAECRRQLLASLLIFYTGEQRSASSILEQQRQAVSLEPSKFEMVRQMVEFAHQGKAALEGGDVEALGRLLDEAWKLKRSLTANISLPVVDEMYESARKAGAWGGKLLGAGGGGFLLVSAPPAVHGRVRTALRSLQELKFRFDRGGTKVVYMSDDQELE
jgi:D-glycero-alpha-D-manno-heptose-7-phosphate kinase